MAEAITIPRQEITTRTFEGRGGITRTVTCFMAQRGDKLIRCESYGERKAQLEEAMQEKKPLQVEGLEYNQIGDCYRVSFPSLSGRSAEYRRQYTVPPAPAYRGKAVPLSVFVGVSKELADLGTMALPVYWRAVEHNLTFPPGYEPSPDVSSPSPAPPSPPPTPAVPPATPRQAIEDSIAVANSAQVLDGLKEMINSTKLADTDKIELHAQVYARRREIK